MGLDNGIVIRAKKNTLSKICKDLHITNDHQNLEIAYWRKCWNLRNDILDAIYPDWHNNELYEYPITKENFNSLLDVLITYLKPDPWEDLDRYENYIDSQQHYCQIVNRLDELFYKYPDIKVYFYDSY